MSTKVEELREFIIDVLLPQLGMNPVILQLEDAIQAALAEEFERGWRKGICQGVEEASDWSQIEWVRETLGWDKI